MLIVHHLGISQSDRVVWLCEELEIPYDLVRYERDAETRLAPPAYRALHPIGTAPVISDGEIVLGESAAIIEYVIHRHGGGRLAVPRSDAAYPDYLFWFHFANGSLVPGLMIDHVTAASGGPAPAGPSRAARAFAVTERRLGDVPYFAGDAFTAADIMMCLPRFAERLDLAQYPNIGAYIARIAARPAWQRTEALR